MSPVWHPVALARDVPVAGTAPARLAGAEIVLWREPDGTPHAWEDRCPHRGMRLSFGFVRGERLACLYHGWQFDGAARCRHIPAHPELKVPGTIRATAWQITERAGLLWVALADTPPPEDGLPDADALPLRSLAIARPFAEVSQELGLPDSGWIWRGDLLLAAHAADTETTMLHAALRTGTAPHPAAARLTALRAELEAA